MKTISFIFKDFTKNIEKDILKAERNVRAKAASYLTKQVKAKLNTPEDIFPSLPGEPPHKKRGKLAKSPSWKHEKENSISFDGGTTKVGFTSPGYHAHLLESGTKQRKTKSGKNRGKISPRPFFFPTLEEHEQAAIKILSEKYGL